MFTVTATVVQHGGKVTARLYAFDPFNQSTYEQEVYFTTDDTNPADIATLLVPHAERLAPSEVCHGWSMPYRASDLDLMVFEFDFDLVTNL